MRLTTKILVGILGILLTINSIWVVYDIRKEIKLNKETINSELNFKFYYIQNQLDDLIKEQKKLNNKIIDLPYVEQLKKEFIEFKLRQSVVFIYNKTTGSLGSGVTIKYNEKFYILSAGHMTDSGTDILSFGENEQEIGELEIIKHDYTTPEENLNGDFTKGTDLILLQPKNKLLIPKYYIELADEEIQAPTEIYIVGNPAGIEDVLCEGRIIKYINNFVYYINHTYYGNSGGGIFTKDGKLLGIVSHMSAISYTPQIPAYMIYGAVRLDIIKSFLKELNK